MTLVEHRPETLTPRFRILDTAVHAVNRESVRGHLGRFLEERRPRQIVTVNVDFLRQASVSPAFNDLINDADLVVPDGRPLVWLARRLGFADCDRVTGPDVIELCAELSAMHGYRLFLLGGAEGLAEQAKLALESAYPGVEICGAYSPPAADYPFTAAIRDEINQRLEQSRPDVVFVAFGCPKQELWIRDHIEPLSIPVAVGVGGSFSFFAGLVPRAPRAFQRCGLEWTYRLYREPRRLWRRYLRDDLPFVLRLAALAAGRRLGLVRRPVFEALDWETR
jgi:N-acetylglucosaminyldiphosphoundecaprenol N-acetyl-beta-D-mannosaminyltransferase